jgi:hypothetical protein
LKILNQKEREREQDAEKTLSSKTEKKIRNYSNIAVQQKSLRNKNQSGQSSTNIF